VALHLPPPTQFFKEDLVAAVAQTAQALLAEVVVDIPVVLPVTIGVATTGAIQAVAAAFQLVRWYLLQPESTGLPMLQLLMGLLQLPNCKE
jgi:hypothetical protein